jgi:hypothetical protein
MKLLCAQCRRGQRSLIVVLMLMLVLVSTQMLDENCVMQAVNEPSQLLSFDESDTLMRTDKDGDSLEQVAALANATDAKLVSLDPLAAHNSRAVVLPVVSNSSSENTGAATQSSGATLVFVNSSRVGAAAAASSSSRKDTAAKSDVWSRLTVAAAIKSSGGVILGGVSGSSSGSSAPTTSSPTPLAQPAADTAPRDPPSAGRAFFC